MIKSMLSLVAIAAMCGITACSPARTQSVAASDLALVQGRLAASEEKMEQLSQQVALLQTMVDSQQRTLQGLGEAGGGEVDAQPLPVVSDTQTSPAAPREDASPAPAVEETSASEDTGGMQDASIPPETSRNHRQEIPATDAETVSEETNPQYQQAMEIFRSGNYDAAGPLFESFTDQFPENDLADNALYWAGECKYTQKKFTEAVQRFKRVVEEYPDGSKVPDALLKIGFAYISLGDSQSAESYLKQVVAQYPFSSAGAKAEERLKKLQGQ